MSRESALFEFGYPERQQAVITGNRRSMLQIFGVKVHFLPDRLEVRGAILTQVLELVTAGPWTTGSVARSPSPLGKGN